MMMMTMMKKLCALVFLVSLLTLPVFGQKIPPVKFSISADNDIWKNEEPAVVKITIENLGDEPLEMSSDMSFRIDDGTRDKYRGEEIISMGNGVYYAPYSLTKSYDEKARGCQNDLSDKNVKRKGPAIIIYRANSAISLKSKEKIERTVDLTNLCWAHVISSMYPYSDVFGLAKTGKYILTLSKSFRVGTEEIGGTKVPLAESVRSNGIEINIEG